MPSKVGAAEASAAIGSGRRRRLLYVVNHAGFFVSHRLPIALRAQAEGFEVHVATPRGDGSESISAAGLPWHVIPLGRSGRNPMREVAAFGALVRLYRLLRPDIVHHVTVKPVLYGSIAARLTRVPAVVNAVSGLGYVFLAEGTRAAVRRAAVRWLYRASFAHPRAATIFQNPDDLESFVAAGLIRRDQAALIPGSGVDLEEYAFVPESAEVDPIVVLASRMLTDKGVREFVVAARTLRAEFPRARFVLVGPLDYDNPAAVTREELETWEREGVVEWAGRRTDMPAVFAEAHVVCLPSYREGLPKVLIEAAACGRAVVTTDVPGCRHAVIAGETALLVPPRDPSSLADAIRALLADPLRRRRMGTAGRVLAETRFGVATIIDSTLAVYRKMLDSKGCHSIP